jgi:hypothetical protein
MPTPLDDPESKPLDDLELTRPDAWEPGLFEMGHNIYNVSNSARVILKATRPLTFSPTRSNWNATSTT